MNDLQQWLNDPDRDYAAGVALFAQHCKNKALVRYFQTGTARFRMAKLVYEMGKLASTAAAKSVSQPQRNVIAPIVETHGRASLHHTQSVIPDFILAAKRKFLLCTPSSTNSTGNCTILVHPTPMMWCASGRRSSTTVSPPSSVPTVSTS